MVKPAIKRNKAAARSCVILGTVLAGTAIWFSVTNSAKPVNQNSALVPAVSSSAVTAQSTAAASTISSSNPVTTQSTAAASTLPQQQVIPRLRTRGS
jgi:hypothetical protein